MVRPVLVIQLPASVSQAQADNVRRQALAVVGESYYVLVVGADVRVSEVGRWVWQRALRRRHGPAL
jgi:hypothetical protein